MKKRSLISLIVFCILLFFARGAWLPMDIRLDTGDTPGAFNSQRPQIKREGSNVYVVWHDSRNGADDIYFNYSADYGTTWQASDIRLDTGDTPGADSSFSPQAICDSSNVYVIWEDSRNGDEDIYFNCSTDGGKTWKTPDTRLDTGDIPGNSSSYYPQITCTDNNVYAVWQDDRNGARDIYFNTAQIPHPIIEANGSSDPITIVRSDTLSITVEFDAGTFAGEAADWWLVALTPLGWFYYDPVSEWLPGREVTLQIPLRYLPTREVFNMSGLPAGTYTFFFGIDLIKNASINMNQAYYSKVRITVNP